MQTKLRDDADLAYLGVGALVDASPGNLHDSDYLELRSPEAGECRVLQAWECAFCGRPRNWAMISIRDGVIREVAAVEMGRAALATAHYIHEDDGRGLAARMTGRASGELSGRALIDALRALAK